MANLGNTIINGILRVNGKLSVSDAITAPSFEGTATKVKGTLTNPTSTTSYFIPYFSESGNGDGKNIGFSNGIRCHILEGTTSAEGLGLLILGNGSASGTAGNKYGALQLASTSSGAIVLRAAATTEAKTIYLPAADGTIALTSSNVASATKATQDGSGNTITSTYYKNTGGTLTTGSYNGVTIKRNGTDGSSVLYSNNNGNLGKMGFGSSGDFIITKGAGTDGTADMLKITSAGAMTTYGNITPSANNTASIGSSSMKYANVYATTFTGALSGNASTATSASKAAQLTTARNINGVSFNGTADININKLVCIDVTGQTIDWNTYNFTNGYTEGIWNSKTDGGANNFTNLAVTGKSSRIELKLCRFNTKTDYIQMQEQWVATTKTLYRRYNVHGTWGNWVTVSVNGVAASATKLATARTIGVSGVTGTAQSFDGSKNIVIPITAVPATLLTNKSAIKGSEITNDKYWIPSSDASVANFVAMTSDEYATESGSLATGTIVAITDGTDGYVSTLPTSLTCNLPTGL